LKCYSKKMNTVPGVRLNHVAILVRSVSTAAKITRSFGFFDGPSSFWEGEGTQEIYVGEKSKTGLLLLMEPVRDGAYSRALQKRGPGLHHIAIDVLNLEDYILSLAGSGWLIHPQSLKTMKSARTAYLARPGVPTLIEVQERDAIPDRQSFIRAVEVPIQVSDSGLLNALGVTEIHPSTTSQAWLTCEEKRFLVNTLLNSFI